MIIAGIETSRCSQTDGGIPKVCLWPPPEKQPNAQSESQDLSSSTISLSVKLTLHNSGKVAAKFDYEPVSIKDSDCIVIYILLY